MEDVSQAQQWVDFKCLSHESDIIVYDNNMFMSNNFKHFYITHHQIFFKNLADGSSL